MDQIQNDNQQDMMLDDIRQLIEDCRQKVAVAVNAGLTVMYWHIGERVNREVLLGERAAYGKQIVASLARQLTEEYGGKQFSEKNLNRMRRFASIFPDISIWTPLVSKLKWSHFLRVLSIDDELKRQFYLTMAADQRWSKRTLKAKIFLRRNFSKQWSGHRTSYCKRTPSADNF